MPASDAGLNGDDARSVKEIRSMPRAIEALGLVLAGGRATRMGGGDKGLRPIRGRGALERALERLGPQLAGGRSAMVLNANGDPARFAAFGLEVLADDPAAAGAGPLAGVHAGLEAARARGVAWVVSVAADTPFFPRDLAARLLDGARAAGAPIALAASDDADGRTYDHPTFGLWSSALADDLRRALVGEGLRKVVAWTDRHGAERVRFERIVGEQGDSVDPFFNVNTPDELAHAERLAAIVEAAEARAR